jgi:hypothetical protein
MMQIKPPSNGIGIPSLPDKTIDDLIQKYLNESIDEIKNKKYGKRSNLIDVINHFFQIKIRFYDYVAKEHGVDLIYLNKVLEQIEIISFWGIGLSDSIEKHIKNNQLFWGLFSNYLVRNEFPSFNREHISKSVNRYERLNTSDLDKAYGVRYVENCDTTLIGQVKKSCFDAINAQSCINYVLSDLQDDSESINCDFKESIEELRKITDSEGNVLVYRGFDFGPGKDVRMHSKKIDNENAHIQETGVGVSFTVEKKIARQFALNKWDSMNNGSSTSWERRVQDNRYILEKSGVDIDSFLSNKVRNAAIGTYKVNTKDILLSFLITSSEKELVILPEKLNLIDYRIIKATKLK